MVYSDYLCNMKFEGENQNAKINFSRTSIKKWEDRISKFLTLISILPLFTLPTNLHPCVSHKEISFNFLLMPPILNVISPFSGTQFVPDRAAAVGPAAR